MVIILDPRETQGAFDWVYSGIRTYKSFFVQISYTMIFGLLQCNVHQNILFQADL